MTQRELLETTAHEAAIVVGQAMQAGGNTAIIKVHPELDTDGHTALQHQLEAAGMRIVGTRDGNLIRIIW